MIVVNMSGVYAAQKFCASKDVQKIDCTDIDETLYFCSSEAAVILRERLNTAPLRALHFIDSGDYHYLSLFFLERIGEPFTLLMFDHHSDCMESAFGSDLLTCGSWVLHALKLPNLRKAILIGPADEDKTAKESGSFSKLVRCSEEELRTGGIDGIRKYLTEGPVYISLDKDVLKGTEAATDWSQGSMSLDEVFEIIDMVPQKNAAGMDVCGEAKRASTGDMSKQDEINNATNKHIADRIGDSFFT